MGASEISVRFISLMDLLLSRFHFKAALDPLSLDNLHSSSTPTAKKDTSNFNDDDDHDVPAAIQLSQG